MNTIRSYATIELLKLCSYSISLLQLKHFVQDSFLTADTKVQTIPLC
jgi:hypothetical protein